MNKRQITKAQANKAALIVKRYAIQEGKKAAKKGAIATGKAAKKGAIATGKAAKIVAKRGFSKLKSLFN